MKNSDIERMFKEQTIDFVPNVLDKVKKSDVEMDLIKPKTLFKRPKLKLYICLSTVFLLLLLLIPLGYHYTSEYQTIYLESNGAVSVGVNRLNLITSISYDDSLASTELKEYDLINKDVDKVIEAFVEVTEKSGYFNSEDAVITIGVTDNKKASSKVEKLESKIKEKIKPSWECDIDKYIASEKDLKNSRDFDVSMGRYFYIKDIMEADDRYTSEYLKGQDMKDLRKIKTENQPGGHNGPGPKR